MLTNITYLILLSKNILKVFQKTANLNILNKSWNVIMPKFTNKPETTRTANKEETKNKQGNRPDTSNILITSQNGSHRQDRRARSEERRSVNQSQNLNFQPHLFLDPNTILLCNALQLTTSSVNSQTHYNQQFYSVQNLTREYFHSQTALFSQRMIANRNINKEKELLKYRFWEDVPENKKPKGKTKPGFFFTVMSYNVLAQNLVTEHPHLYHSHDPKTLEWKLRWRNLLKEIKKLLPDIICLQEVQESHIPDYFSLLETLGYEGVYKKRTGIRQDGCAIYYKVDLLNLAEFTTVEYNQPNISVLDRDNVAIIAKFCPKLHKTREFVVSTTHLLYNPKRQDVRLAQMQVLMAEIERISFKGFFEKENPYLPVIITGDLNSVPFSAVYSFVTQGELQYENLSPRTLQNTNGSGNGKVLVPKCLRITDTCQHVDLLEKRNNNEETTRTEEFSLIVLNHSEKNISKKNVARNDNIGLFSSGKLSHQFAFKSVYNHGVGSNLEGTSFQDQWLTLDYIFYSGKKQDNEIEEDKIKLISRYRLPSVAELNGINIPNNFLGSDHLCLVAKFKLEY